MLKYSFLGVIVLILSILAGWYLGYAQGARNQMYFDAVARASLYEKALNSPVDKGSKMLKGFLFKQQCLLASDFNFDTLTINHPAHEDVYGYYKENIGRICLGNKCECVQAY